HIGAEPSARDFYNIGNIVVEAISTK
ncbi:TPA: hypothetical protein ACSK3W_002032, partial [Listeria monocytogenes]